MHKFMLLGYMAWRIYSMGKFHDPEDAPKIMSLQLLSKITNNFSEERKLGSGTYGEVFKASIPCSHLIYLTANA